VTRVLLGLAIGLALAAALVRIPATSGANLDALARDVDREADHVSAAQLAEWMREKRPDLHVIDLRSDSEYAADHIPGAQHMSVSALRHAGFHHDATIVLYSAGGGHAAQAWFILRSSGFDHVYSLRGGMDEWRARPAWRGLC